MDTACWLLTKPYKKKVTEIHNEQRFQTLFDQVFSPDYSISASVALNHCILKETVLINSFTELHTIYKGLEKTKKKLVLCEEFAFQPHGCEFNLTISCNLGKHLLLQLRADKILMSGFGYTILKDDPLDVSVHLYVCMLLPHHHHQQQHCSKTGVSLFMFLLYPHKALISWGQW